MKANTKRADGGGRSMKIQRNCLLEITQLPEALKMSEEGVAKAGQKGRLVRVTMRDEVNCIPVS